MLWLSRLSVLAVMLGWSTWFAICNVYEFAPRLDPLAFALGWLVTLVLLTRSFRAGQRATSVAPLFAIAACNALYVLLVHAGMGKAIALAVLVGATGITLGMMWRRAARSGAAHFPHA